MAELFWRLYYADDSFMDEPVDNASILVSRPDPVVLVVCQGALRIPLCKVELFDNDAKYKPIFYRKRSIDLDAHAEARTDLVVFGRARTALVHAGASRADVQFDGTLYASSDGHHVQNCPPNGIDEAAIQHLLLDSY